MTEPQAKHLKFLKGCKSKFVQDEDWKGAAGMSSQIEKFESECIAIENAMLQKEKSPLR